MIMLIICSDALMVGFYLLLKVAKRGFCIRNSFLLVKSTTESKDQGAQRLQQLSVGQQHRIEAETSR